MHSADGWDGVLKPVVTRYQGKVSRIYFRGDAAFAMPEVYEFLEAERIKYAIRLPANQVLQSRIGYRSSAQSRTGCVGFTPISPIKREAGLSRAGCVKVEWHPGQLYPRVGFIVNGPPRLAERVVAFYNKRGTCEQWIKKGQGCDQMDTTRHEGHLRPTPCGSSFKRSPTISAISCTRWRGLSRSRTGR